MKKLYQELKEYASENVYPFHMPGHKRNPDFRLTDFPYEQDITEITGFDNLHQPEGIILEAEKRAAELFGAEETFFSVNGSTALILSAISACVKRGGRILMARNSHRSAYHAMYLRDLSPKYIYPMTDEESGLNGSISPGKVERMLQEDPEIEAVFVTSPTYDGVVSDIRGIAEAAHRHQVPLIVDEAHGSHFVFSNYFPESAIRCGADLVVHSIHKTLPAPTQTALLHLCSEEFVDREQLARFLGIYQTSSPSYVLMAGIDACMERMRQNGKELFRGYTQILEKSRKRLASGKYLRLVTPETGEGRRIFDYDRSKLIISTTNSALTGTQLHQILRSEFSLELEMDALSYVLALTSVGDTPEGFERLCAAAEALESREEVRKPAEPCEEENSFSTGEPKRMLRISEAMELPSVSCPLEESMGQIAAEMVALYPPGIPLIVPGEQISGLFVRSMKRYIAQGLTITGLRDPEKERIQVVQS